MKTLEQANNIYESIIGIANTIAEVDDIGKICSLIKTADDSDEFKVALEFISDFINKFNGKTNEIPATTTTTATSESNLQTVRNATTETETKKIDDVINVDGEEYRRVNKFTTYDIILDSVYVSKSGDIKIMPEGTTAEMQFNTVGYWTAKLPTKKLTYQAIRVDFIVLEAFTGKTTGKDVSLTHINKNHRDCRLSNLEIVPRGGAAKTRLDGYAAHKISEALVASNFKLPETFMWLNEHKLYEIGIRGVSQVLNKEGFSHISDMYFTSDKKIIKRDKDHISEYLDKTNGDILMTQKSLVLDGVFDKIDILSIFMTKTKSNKYKVTEKELRLIIKYICDRAEYGQNRYMLVMDKLGNVLDKLPKTITPDYVYGVDKGNI
jgi:hypothetical protein